jgi:iron complex outermembrane recepter protein
MITLTYQKEKALFGGDRKFSSSGINTTFLNDTTSGNTFPANVAAVDGSLGTRNPTFPDCPGPYAVHSPLFDLIGSLGCRFDPAPLVTMVPETKRFGIFASGRIQLSQAAEIYGEASFARNKQNTVIQPTPISDQFALAPNNPLFNVAPYNGFSTIIVTSASPYYPTAFIQSQTGGATPDLLVRWRASALGNRDFTDTSDAPRLNFGVKGTVGTVDYDGGALYSESKVTEKTNNGYVIQSQVLPILNSDQVNFWGPNSDAVQDQLNATEFRGTALQTKTSLAGVYAKGSSELAQIAGGPLALAAGGEFRKEKYKLDPSPEILAGDLTGYGGNFLPVDVSRSVYAVFTELNVPIIRTLEANFAVRYDHYQGSGNSTTPKVSLRFQPAPEVLLRASWGRGFRAPSLLDLYAPQTTGVTQAGSNDPLRCSPPLPAGQGTGQTTDCNTQFANLNGGNPDLKPEKSRNITAGIVLEPTNNISFGVDWFNIRITDTINNGIPSATILDPATYNQFSYLVTRGPVDPAFPNLPGPILSINQTNINVGENRLEGVDIDAKLGIPAGALGKFTVSLNGTYFSKFDQQNIDGTFTGTVDQANTATGGVVPRWKHYLALNWGIGPWSTTVAQNYQSSYTDFPGTFDGVNSPPDPPQIHLTVGSYETYDFQT